MLPGDARGLYISVSSCFFACKVPISSIPHFTCHSIPLSLSFLLSLYHTVGSDFAATSINVLFDRTATRMCYNFSITDDEIGEPNEVFQVMLMILSPPEVATAPEPTANITIIDDDGKIYF